ncbi:hypothetical protein PO909_026501 [Leuciscus waleckii]
MGCKRQKLRRWTTKRRGKHHQKLSNSVHGHSSNASGVFSQKATPVGETRLCWSTATDESSDSPGTVRSRFIGEEKVPVTSALCRNLPCKQWVNVFSSMYISQLLQ